MTRYMVTRATITLPETPLHIQVIERNTNPSYRSREPSLKLRLGSRV